MLAGCRPAQNAEEEWREAGQFVQELSACWKAEDYERAKKLIDAKLSSKPGWLPAKTLESSYYRYIEGDSAKAVSIFHSIEKTVNALDQNEYAGFIGAYSLYKSAVEKEGAFAQEEKEARLELARRVFTYFPGAEIVAFYFDRIVQQHQEDAGQKVDPTSRRFVADSSSPCQLHA